MRTIRTDNLAERVERPEKVSAARMRLWHAIHEFCRHHGAAVTSLPGHRHIRIEMTPGSPLTAKLVDAGYDPQHRCTETRILGGRFVVVDVISITLPASAS